MNPVRNFSRGLNPAAAAGPEGLSPSHEALCAGGWPGGSSGALFLTG